MTKEQEFRKQTEEAKFEAFSLMCKKVAELEQKLEQTEKDLSDYQFNYPTIKELQKEKAEFKEQLARITEERNGYKITVNSYEHTIKDLRKENAEQKEQINEWLNAYSDTYFVKVLRSCIFQNEKLSSQEQQQLSAWVECAMDFGTKLDECADQLTKAKDLLAKWVELYNPKIEDFPKTPIQVDTEKFLKESE